MSQCKVFAGVYCWSVIFAATCFGQPPESETTSESPAAEQSWYETNLRYAKTRWLLAEAELLSVLEVNKEAPGTIAKLAVERLRSDAEIAKQQFREAEMATVGGSERVRLRHAQERIRLARINLVNGRELHDKGRLSDLELERLKLKHELAGLSLVLLKNPQYFATMLQSLEAKVDRMGEEILSLDQRISRLEPIRGVVPKNQ